MSATYLVFAATDTVVSGGRVLPKDGAFAKVRYTPALTGLAGGVPVRVAAMSPLSPLVSPSTGDPFDMPATANVYAIFDQGDVITVGGEILPRDGARVRIRTSHTLSGLANGAGVYVALVSPLSQVRTPAGVSNGNIDYPLVRQEDMQYRENARAYQIVPNPVYQNENAWTRFSDAEKASMDRITVTSMEDLRSSIQARPGGANALINYILNFDGGALSGGGGYLDCPQINGIPAGSLTNSAAVDFGKVRPNWGLYLTAAPGRTPSIPFSQWNGVSKVEIDGVRCGTVIWAAGGSYPLLPMVSIRNSPSCNWQGGSGRVLQVENSQMNSGRMLSGQPHFARFFLNKVRNGRDDTDIMARRGYDKTYHAQWQPALWVAGNLIYEMQKLGAGDPGGNGHFDAGQDGTGEDKNILYRTMWEYNIFYVETVSFRNVCQGKIQSGVKQSIADTSHNNIYISSGSGYNFWAGDYLDQQEGTFTRNFLMHNGTPYGQNASGVEGTPDYNPGNTSPQPINCHFGSSQVYLAREVNPLAKEKRLVENIASGNGFDTNKNGGTVNKRYSNGNVNATIMPYAIRLQRLQNVITGNDSYIDYIGYVTNRPDRANYYQFDCTGYEDPTGGTSDATIARTAILAFVKPRRGWRWRNAGPNPEFWPATVAEIMAQMATPPAPSLARPPVFSVNSAPTPSKTPVLVDGVVARVGDHLDIEYPVYLNGGPRTGFIIKTADTIGGAMTDLDALISRQVPQSLKNKYLYIAEAVSNVSGDFVLLNGPYGPIGAPLPVLSMTEPWSRIEVELPASAAGEEILTKIGPSADPIAAPLYNRATSAGSSGMAPVLITDAGSPTGKMLWPKCNTASVTSTIWRTDVEAQLLLPWLTFECRTLIRLRSGTSQQTVNIGDNTTGAGASYTGLLLAGPTGAGDGAVSIQRASGAGGSTAMTSGKSSATAFWAAFRCSPGLIEAKVWDYLGSEPAYGDVGTGSVAGIVDMKRVGITGRSGANSSQYNPCARILQQDFAWMRP